MDDPKQQASLDNRANQLNPNNEKFAGSDNNNSSDLSNDNHANQLNPNHDEYKGDLK